MTGELGQVLSHDLSLMISGRLEQKGMKSGMDDQNRRSIDLRSAALESLYAGTGNKEFTTDLYCSNFYNPEATLLLKKLEKSHLCMGVGGHAGIFLVASTLKLRVLSSLC